MAIEMTAEKMDAMRTMFEMGSTIKEHLDALFAIEAEKAKILETVQPELDKLSAKAEGPVNELAGFVEDYEKAVEVLGSDPLDFLATFRRAAGIKSERKRRPEDRASILTFLTAHPGSKLDDVLTGAGVDDEAYVRGVIANLVSAKKATSEGPHGGKTYTLVTDTPEQVSKNGK